MVITWVSNLVHIKYDVDLQILSKRTLKKDNNFWHNVCSDVLLNFRYHPIVRHIMSGRRSEKILRCFNNEYANYTNVLVDPMKKLYPIFDMLFQNFQKSYFTDYNLSLDESLLLHRGRLIYKRKKGEIW